MPFKPYPFTIMDATGRSDVSDGSELIDAYAVNVLNQVERQVAYTIQNVPYVHGDFKAWLYTRGEGVNYVARKNPVILDGAIEGAEARLDITYDDVDRPDLEGVHGMVMVNASGQEKLFGLCRGDRFFEMNLHVADVADSDSFEVAVDSSSDVLYFKTGDSGFSVFSVEGFTLDPANTIPSGITATATRLYIVNNNSTQSKVYVYGLDGTRYANEDFNLDPANTAPSGITATATRLYIVNNNSTQSKVYVYGLDGTRYANEDFNLDPANNIPSGITATATRLYIVDSFDEKVYVYGLDGTRYANEDFNLDPANNIPSGITATATRLYIVDSFDEKVYVYGLDGTRYANEDFNLDNGITNPRSIAATDTRIYVVDNSTPDRAFSYGLDGTNYSNYIITATFQENESLSVVFPIGITYDNATATAPITTTQENGYTTITPEQAGTITITINTSGQAIQNNNNNFPEKDTIEDFPVFPTLDKTALNQAQITTTGQATTFLQTPLARFTTNSNYTLDNGQIEKLVTDGRYVFFVVNGRVFVRDTSVPYNQAGDWPINDTTQYDWLENGAEVTEDDGTTRRLPPSLVVDIAWIDHYFIICTSDGFIYHTNIDDPAEVNALNFASAESNPDEIVGVETLRRRVYIYGSNSVEMWYNAGTEHFPFRRENAHVFNQGARTKHTIAKNDIAIFHTGTDDIVYENISGFKRISTEPVEKDLSASNSDRAHAFCYTEEGHRFYSLTMIFDDGSKVNWTYDQTTGLWHKRSETDIVDAVLMGRRHALIGRMSGGAKIEMMSLSAIAAEPRTTIAVLPVFRANLRTVNAASFQIVLDQETYDPNGKVLLRYSDDGKQTWSPQSDRDIADWTQNPDYEPKIKDLTGARRRWDALGRIRDGRNWSIWVSSDRAFTISSAYHDMRVQMR